jgi:cob(I)alamin adenosyltransferase
MVRLNRIYTKAGDGGDTRLVGGQKVRKDSLRIEAYGTIDELSACIGLARTTLGAPGAPEGAAALAAILLRMQNELFNLGSDLATRAEDRRPTQPVIEPRHAAALETEIDAWNETRAERLIVRLGDSEPIGAAVIPYVNRLSDALFVMSRHAARLYGEPEPLWEPEKT